MVQRPLETEWIEEVEERKKDLSTQVGGRREENHRKHQLLISVCRMQCVSSLFIKKNSQLISDKLWKQVIQIILSKKK